MGKYCLWFCDCAIYPCKTSRSEFFFFKMLILARDKRWKSPNKFLHGITLTASNALPNLWLLLVWKDLHIVQKWTNTEREKLKLKIQDFCPPDIESCHIVTGRCVKLWSLNSNLFFKEPHQLTKFTLEVHLNNIWQRTFNFKDLIAIFWGLQTPWPYQLTKPDFSDLGYFLGHVLSKTKSVTPNFFAFLAIVYHCLSAWQV